MSLALIAAPPGLEVEGPGAAEGSPRVRGRVLAIAARAADSGPGPAHFLVADPRQPAPVWLSAEAVTAHRLVPAGPARAGTPHHYGEFSMGELPAD